MSVLIRQAKIVDPQSDFHNKVVDILIESGMISSIGKVVDSKNAEIISAEGLHVSPGFTDVFADYREPGYEQKETIESGLKCAAAGGFTDVMLGPNTNPAISSKSTIQYITGKAAGNVVNLHPLGAITQETEGKALAEMHDMHAHGAIAFTDGWKPVQNANLMLKAFEYIKAFDGILLQIPIDTSLTAGGLMHEGPTSTRLGMAGIPVLAESIFLHRDIALLRYTGSRLHVTGISTAEGVDMIRKAKKEGLNITCSVTPYHLALTDEALTGYDSLYKVAPVLRSENDRQALITALKEGTIDCIASHHRPQEWDSKTKEFEYAGEGMNIQESAFSIVWTALENKVPLERVIDAFSMRPREIFGLQPAGISVGNTAAFTIFTIREERPLKEENSASLSRNNPFFGKNFKGGITGIINHNRTYLNNNT